MDLAMDLIREALLGGSGGGGGGGGMTKMFEKTYPISTTSTSAIIIDDTLEDVLEPNKWHYFLAIDTAGPANDHLLANEGFIRYTLYDNDTKYDVRILLCEFSYTSTGSLYTYTSPTYGIYLTSNGKDKYKINAKYHSQYTRAIDGNYKISIYSLDAIEPAPIE